MRYINLIIAALLISLYALAEQPDFAFPKKVEQASKKNFEKELKHKNYPEATRSLMNLLLAKGEIDKTSLTESLPLLRKTAEEATDSAFKGMLILLQAQITADIYSERRYVYDERKLPLNPLPDDIFEWSGDQFRNSTLTLLDSLVQFYPALGKTKLTNWRNVINCQDKALPFYPTLLQFAANRSLSIAQRVRDSQPVLPTRMIEKSFGNSNSSDFASESDKITYRNYMALLDAAKNNSALYVQAEISRIKWVSDRLNYKDREEKKRTELMRLYNDFADDPVSALILLQIGNISYYNSNFKYIRDTWDLAGKYLADFPESVYSSSIKALRNKLMEGSSSLSFRSAEPRGRNFSMLLSVRNLPSVTVDIYKIARNKPQIRREDLTNIVKSITVEFDASKPFETDTALVVNLNDFGLYTAVIRSNKSNYGYLPSLIITDFYLSAFNPAIGKSFATVRNITTGKPISGVNVQSYKKNTPVFSSISRNDGWAETDNNGNRLYASSGNDRYAAPLYYNKPQQHSQYLSCLLTSSLPIYHPGDSLEFAGLVYNTKQNGRKAEAGITVKYTLLNTNSQEIDSGSIKADSFGRITGGSKLPADGLTGIYRLRIAHGKDIIGYYNFTVADYKLPTFYVSLSQATDTIGDYITLKGNAVTFSGFPISESAVSIEVRAETPRLYFYGYDSSEPFLNINATTDSNGCFTINIPADKLRSPEFANKRFSATANVTSGNGETRSASTSLSVGKPYFVSFNMPESYDLTSLSPIYKTYDIKNEEKNIPANIEILKNDSTVLRLSPDNLKALSALPTALYRVRIIPADTLLASVATSQEIMMYNPDKREFDADHTLWTPSSSISLEHKNGNYKGELLIGTNRDSVHIEKIISTSDSLISREWIMINAGLNHIPVTISDKFGTTFIHISTVKDGEWTSKIITAPTPDSNRKIKLTYTSFRDKTLSGSTEKWTVKTTFGDGSPARSAIIINALSDAINNISPAKPLSISPFYRYLTNNFSNANNYKHSVSGYVKYANNVDCMLPDVPDFNTYGISWTGSAGNSIRIRGGAKFYNAVQLTAAKAEVASISNDEAIMEEEKVADTGSEADSENKTNESGAKDNTTYRQSEVPLALFEPSLSTDTDGNLSFSFTLPDATTTWKIFTTAFTDDLIAAFDTRTLIASKPVMVSTAAPRFLRAGDSAIIAATIMNASENDLADVSITAEILNVSATKILATKSIKATIEKGGKKTVDLSFTVPENITGAIFRVKAISDNYTDAEQSTFPILPASERVVEAIPFYMAPDSTTLSLSLDTDPGMISSMEFCENAAWSVVQALPGISSYDASTSTAAAKAIFSAAVANGIIKNNPGVASHLRQIAKASNNDSIAISNLARNEDVKLAMLAATPWIQDEMSDTERIERLSLLFSNKEIDKALTTNIRTLAKLVRSNGWAWSSCSDEPSVWATEDVLYTFAMLKQLGFLPKNTQLNNMIDNAMKWLDTETARANSGKPKATISTMYTYLRTVFPGKNIPTGARRTITATVNSLVANAMGMPLKEKAFAAIILNSNGYPGTAAKLLDSIEEFSSTSAIGAVSWKNLEASQYSNVSDIAATATILDAYSTIKPSSKLIDGIRLWLINEKSRRDWGDSRSTTYAIAAILESGSNWTPPTVPRSAIRINNGEPMTFSPTDIATGYFRTQIPSGKITVRIDKVGSFPAYGAIYSTGSRTLSGIKPVSLPELSVSKETYIRKDGKWHILNEEITPGCRLKTVTTIKSQADLSYVVITDNRPACFEPTVQIPHSTWSQGIRFYKEPRNSATNIFVDFLPKGIYILEEEFNADRAGKYFSGTVTLQSEYAPAYSVRSGATTITVKP